MKDKIPTPLEELEKLLSDIVDDFNPACTDTTLAIMPLGLDVIVLEKEEIIFSYVDKKNTRLTILGTVEHCKASLTVPGKNEKWWFLDYGKRSNVSFSDILIQTGIDKDLKCFPQALLSLVNVEVLAHHVEFDRQCALVTRVMIDFGPQEEGKWVIIPSVLTLSEPLFKLSTSYFAYGDDSCSTTIGLVASGRLTIGRISVIAKVKMAMRHPWSLTFESENLTIGLLADMLFGGQQSAMTEGVPTGLLSLETDLALNRAELLFDIYKPAITSVCFELVQTGRWEFLPHLALYNWSLLMQIVIDSPKNIYKGMLKGNLDIGNNLKLEVFIPLPISAGNCSVGLKPDTILHFPGLGDLLKSLTGNQINGLPQNLATFGACDIERLTFTGNLPKGTLSSVNFQMRSSDKWVVVKNFLEFTDVSAELIIINTPTGFQSTGKVNCSLEILKQGIIVKAFRNKIAEPWSFNLELTESLHIPGFREMASWLMPSEFERKLPSSIMPFDRGLDLRAMSVAFNATTGEFEKLTFDIKNSAPWVIVEKYLVVDKAYVLGVVADSGTLRKLDLSIYARLCVDEATIVFTADYHPDDPWILKAALENPVSLEFSRLLVKLQLKNEFTIPQDLKLPTLTINRIEGVAVPAEKKFKFTGDITVTSELELLGMRFKMLNLQTEVDVQSDEYRRVALKCTLDMDRFKIAASVSFGTAEIPTIFYGSLLLADLSLAELSNMISPKSWEDITPVDIIQEKYPSGTIAKLNVTKSETTLAGKIEGIGTLFFHSQVLLDRKEKRGYVACFMLDDKFCFASLFKGLSLVDEVIAIRSAAVLISSYAAVKAELYSSIDDLILWNGNPLSLLNPLSGTLIPSSEIVKGTHIYAEISFKGWISELLGQIAEDIKQNTLTLYALIPHESAAAEFVATLPAISIWGNAIAMPAGTILKYTSGAEKKFSIAGVLSLKLFNKQYDFESNLAVDNAEVVFTTTLLSSEDSVSIFPEVLPDFFELQEFTLGGNYHFATATDEKYLEFILAGRVNLGTLGFSAALHLIGNTPVFAYIRLEKNLTLSTIINDLVGGGFKWPESVFDITLRGDTLARRSMVYYYNPPEGFVNRQLSVPDGVTLKKGYNLEAAVDLTFLTTISFSLQLNIEKDRGVTAAVALLNPINLFIVELASSTADSNGKYLCGPELYIRSTAGTVQFGLSTGINFLGYGFGTADISIGKVQVAGGKSEMLISAKTAIRKVPFFGSLPLNFNYSQSRGLKLDDLPLQLDYLTRAFDLAKEIKKVMDAASCAGDGVCGIIADLFIKVAYDDIFKLTPGFECNTQQAKMYLTLGGNYSIRTAGILIVEVPFKGIVKIGLGADTRFDDLGELVKGALSDIAGSLVQGIIANGEACAKMLVLLFGKEALRIAAKLLCLGLIKNITSKAITAGGAAASAAAAIAAIATVFSHGGGGGGGDDDEPGEDDDPDTGEDTPEEKIPNAPTIDGGLRFENERMYIRWHGVRYAAGYEVQFLDTSGNVIENTLTVGLDIYEASVVAPSLLKVGIYKVQVRSRRGEKVSAWASATCEKLDTPAFTMMLNKQKREVICESAKTVDTAKYHFTLKNENDEVLFSKDSDTSSVCVNYNELKGEIKKMRGYFFISKEGCLASETVTSKNVISTTQNPNSVDLSLEGASWDNVTGNNGYEVKFDYLHESPVIVTKANETRVQLPNVPDCDLVVHVHTLGDENTIEEEGSRVSNRLPMPLPRPKPVHVCTPVKNGEYIVIPWNTDDLAPNQRVEIQVFMDGKPLEKQPDIKYHYTKARVVISSLKWGEKYQFRARAIYARENELLFYSAEQYEDEIWTICDTTDKRWLSKRDASLVFPDGLWQKKSQIIELRSYGYQDEQLALAPVIEASLTVTETVAPYCLYVELWDDNYHIIASKSVFTETSGLLNLKMNSAQPPAYIYVENAGLKGSQTINASLRLTINSSCPINDNSEWSDLSSELVLT